MKHNDDIIFVYGALRSGTTVFRLMLDAHPQIGNPGEMDFLLDHLQPDAAHPTGWRYDVEALRLDWIFRSAELALPPDCDGLDLLDDFFAQLKARAPGQVLSINLHRHVDRLFAALPEARVIHMLRDPRDVARSSIQMGWAGTLYHGVGHWIETEKAWDAGTRTVPAPQILEISYEGLFEDVSGTLDKVCAFFGVDYTPEMLSYYENTTYGPPDVKLTRQWTRKAAPRELAELEARAGALMAQRGYPVSQPPLQIGTMQLALLTAKNKLYCWKFGMKRFGIVIYWGERLTRWTGLTRLHRRVRQRMDTIVIEHHLK